MANFGFNLEDEYADFMAVHNVSFHSDDSSYDSGVEEQDLAEYEMQNNPFCRYPMRDALDSCECNFRFIQVFVEPDENNIFGIYPGLEALMECELLYDTRPESYKHKVDHE